MKIAPVPVNESERLAELKKYNILDTAAEEDFDEIVKLASLVCDAPISTITLIDKDRQWFKAKVGVSNQEGPRDTSFCGHAINQDDILIIPDATKDERFADNPLVTDHPDIRFYAGMPMKSPAGLNLGTLCVIDTKPKDLSESQLFCLKVLTKQAAKLMELRKKNDELAHINDANTKLLSVIGHDLRSPLTSLHGLLELVEKYDLPPDEFKKMVPNIRKALVNANELLSDMLEWAASQFQQNITRPAFVPLHQLAGDVIKSNLTSIQKKKNTITNLIDKKHVVWADENSVKFVLRNLIVNANKFTENGTITLTSVLSGQMVETCVKDTGVGIEHSRLEKLFLWESRKSTTGTQGEKGSGIALRLCREFIEKNSGTIRVESVDEKGAAFYFSLPGK